MLNRAEIHRGLIDGLLDSGYGHHRVCVRSKPPRPRGAASRHSLPLSAAHCTYCRKLFHTFCGFSDNPRRRLFDARCSFRGNARPGRLPDAVRRAPAVDAKAEETGHPAA